MWYFTFSRPFYDKIIGVLFQLNTSGRERWIASSSKKDRRWIRFGKLLYVSIHKILFWYHKNKFRDRNTFFTAAKKIHELNHFAVHKSVRLKVTFHQVILVQSKILRVSASFTAGTTLPIFSPIKLSIVVRYLLRFFPNIIFWRIYPNFMFFFWFACGSSFRFV